MNVLDIVICILVAWGLIRGFFRGLIGEVTSIIGVVAGFLGANTFYQETGEYLYGWVSHPDSAWVLNPEYSRVAAFIALFLAFYFLVVLAGWAIKALTKVSGLGWVDRVGGVLFGLVKASLIAMLLIAAYTAIMPRGKAVWVNESALTPHVNVITEKVIQVIPWDLKEGFRNKIREAKQHWTDRTT